MDFKSMNIKEVEAADRIRGDIQGRRFSKDVVTELIKQLQAAEIVEPMPPNVNEASMFCYKYCTQKRLTNGEPLRHDRVHTLMVDYATEVLKRFQGKS